MRSIFHQIVLLLALGAVMARAQNDKFANATDLSDLPLPYSGFFGASSTAELGEPAHAGSPAANSIWFQFKVPQTGAYSFREYLNTSPAARIAIYIGDQVDALTLVKQGTSVLFFQAQAGVRYHIAVDSVAADVVNLQLYPAGGADEVANADPLPAALPQRILGNNVLATTAAGDENSIPIYPPRNTVWWRWTAPVSGSVRLDARRCNFYPLMIIYEQVPGGSRVNIRVGFRAAGFEVTAGNDYYFRVGTADVEPGRIDISFDWIPAGAPPNDNIVSATDLGNASIACDDAWIYRATPEAGLPNENPPQFGQPGDRTLWWKWTCPKSGFYRVSARGSDVIPMLNLYTGTPAALTFVTGQEIEEGLRFTATAGTLYWIQLNDYRKICPHAELNLHPAHTETSYFRQLDNRGYFGLLGPQHHPKADPDGDSFSNEVELACSANPEMRGPFDSLLPHLVSAGSGVWRLRWNVDRQYVETLPGLPITVIPRTTTDLAAPWQTPAQSTDATGSHKIVNLPVGGRGFARLEVHDPNLELL
ncbi:MAG: hypothetical protein ACRCXD_07100 [Luteolibacter sp.]